MEDHHAENIKECIVHGLRELYRRIEREDDFESRCAIWWLEGYFLKMIEDLRKPEEAGK